MTINVLLAWAAFLTPTPTGPAAPQADLGRSQVSCRTASRVARAQRETQPLRRVALMCVFNVFVFFLNFILEYSW